MYKKLVDALEKIDEVIDNAEATIRITNNHDEYEGNHYLLVHLKESKHRLISAIHVCEKMQKVEV